MIKLTEILSKPIISLSNCKTEGIVRDAVFDKNFKRLKFLILFDNDEHLDDKSLNINSIYSYGENAIVVKDDEDLSLVVSNMQTCDKSNVINCNCYTYLGKFLGKVVDILLDEKYYVKGLVVGQTTIEINDIINTGEDTVIVQDKEVKINVTNLKRKKKKCVQLQDIKLDNSQKVYILNPQEKFEEAEVKEENTNIEEDVKEWKEKTVKEMPKIKYKLTELPSNPMLVTTNYEFLIGRKLDRNLYSQNLELIARKNTKITTDIINKARLLNKTRELIKFSH